MALTGGIHAERITSVQTSRAHSAPPRMRDIWEQQHRHLERITDDQTKESGRLGISSRVSGAVSVVPRMTGRKMQKCFCRSPVRFKAPPAAWGKREGIYPWISADFIMSASASRCQFKNAIWFDDLTLLCS
ncbi:hypothetical protein EMCG_08400 [[Emmonsia] crescens]|uniref:Uncharacterized protein n=1 Tax=[Emmonsia] crescens TaxID=73230 RepID=A0A0G2I6Q7_9EURO|nr:hypothetical protein EMCG_08400 [Emmonsia crescens UAMH 3008]